MKTVPNLSIALTILARAEAAEHFMHSDVSAFNAPSECHDAVRRGEADRMRIARKHAEAVTGRSLRCIRRDVAQTRRLRAVVTGVRQFHGQRREFRELRRIAARVLAAYQIKSCGGTSWRSNAIVELHSGCGNVEACT